MTPCVSNRASTAQGFCEVINLGVDVGSLATKVLILNESKILSRFQEPTGDDVREAVSRAISESLAKAGLSRNRLERIISTGVGRNHVSDASKSEAEGRCSVAGVRHLFPSVRGLLDVGAESSRALKFDNSGRVVGFASNDKCASGTGIFLDTMSKLLQIRPDDLEALQKAEQKVNITSTCVVFAESEVVSLIHKGVNRFDLWMAINSSVASKAYALVGKLRLDGEVAIIGGVAKNQVFIHCLRDLLGERVLVPESPEFVNALGAAIIGRESAK